MPSFKKRSAEKELLDRDDIPFEDIKKNMQELDQINSLLGGHAISLKGFRSLVNKHKGKKIRVVEIGCGGGDNLRMIKNYAAKRNIEVELTGVDINPECISYARSVDDNKNIFFVCSDYRNYIMPGKPDVIFSSLFCHHFSDQQLVEMLQWMTANCNTGFFINDLHRHPLAYYSIRMLTSLFSRSYLVKNDAPVSVMRGFKKTEWISILNKAGIKNYNIAWCWAFRWLITVRNND
jgi:SAM-dependent methyltransferase